MATWYVSRAGWTAVTPWAAGQVVSTGAIRRQLAAVTQGNERCFRCTTGGTTGGAEPSWTLTLNGTTNDNGVVWTECTGQETYQSAGNWTAPSATLDLIAVNSGGRGATDGSDNVYMANDHTETWTTARDWTRVGQLQVVTVAGSALPPTPASHSTGAAITTTGATNVQIAGGPHLIDGVTLSIGSGAVTASLQIGRTAFAVSYVEMRNCSVLLASTGASSRITLSQIANGNLVFRNTRLSFGAAGQAINFSSTGAYFNWFDTDNALYGTVPTNLILSTAVNNSVLMEGVDLSSLSTTLINIAGGATQHAGFISVRNCKLHASVTLVGSPSIRSESDVLQFINCDNGTDNRAVHSIYGRIGGSCRTNFIVFDPDAATTPESDEFCWALLPRDLTNGPPTSSRYPTTPWLHLWATTPGAKTVTIEAMAQMSSMPTNAEVWLEVKYLDDAGDVRTDLVSTQALFSGAAAVANTASSHAWDCVNTRVDSASYSIGDVFKVGTNAGRVFYCTTGGAATSPIPAAYASATDGTAVTDGTATFEAMRRMTLTAAFTVARSGPVAVRVCDARRLSTMTILYVSPSPVIA